MILLLGKGGQLSSAFAEKLGAKADVAGIDEADFSRADFIKMLDGFTNGKKYQAVINAAAYTQVDKAEGEGRALNFRINADAVSELAGWCKIRALPLIHYSTDYVYDGSGNSPRKEDAPTNPLNAYGEAKLAGEKAVMASGADYIIFRTSWLYDAQGKNFFNTMLRLFSEKDSLKVVADQVGAPTYVPQLADASLVALEHALAMEKFPSGVYHLANSGETSWHGFAQEIFALATARDSGQKSLIRCGRIEPITTSEYPLPARRPLNSRLDCSKAFKILGIKMPDWQDGLKECFEEKYASK